LTYSVNNTRGRALRPATPAQFFGNTQSKDRFAMPAGDHSREGDIQQAAGASARLRRLKVSELLAGEREAILEHGGQDYRLRITANGKLILTK
jgi:hemin uptake protein HemP